MNGYLVMWVALVALTVILVWRGRRRDRWHASGRCYQCGKAPGFDAKAVTLRFKAPSAPKHVTFCRRCAAHRTVWSYLVGTLIAVFVVLLWFGVRNGGVGA